MASADSKQKKSLQLDIPITMPETNQATTNADVRKNEEKSRKRSSRRSRRSSAGSSSSPDSPRSPGGGEADGNGGSGLFRRLRSFFSKKEQEEVVEISGVRPPSPSKSSYKPKEVHTTPQGPAPTALKLPQPLAGGESPRLTSQLRVRQLPSARTVAEVTPDAKTQADGRSDAPPQAFRSDSRFPRSLSEGTLLSEDSPAGSHPVHLTVKLIKSLDDRNSDPLTGSRKIILIQGTRGFGLVLGGASPVIVMKVEPNGPADRAGILVNDMIVAVNKIDVRNRSYADVQLLINEASRRSQLMEPGKQVAGRSVSSSNMPLLSAPAAPVNLKRHDTVDGKEAKDHEVTSEEKAEMGEGREEDSILKQLQEAAGMIADAAMSNKPDLPPKPDGKDSVVSNEEDNDGKGKAFEEDKLSVSVPRRRGSLGETQKRPSKEEILALSKSAPASPSTQRRNKLRRASSQKGGAFIVEHKSGRMVAVPSRPSILPADESAPNGKAPDPKKVHIDSGYMSLSPGDAEVSELEAALALASARMNAGNKQKPTTVLPSVVVTADKSEPSKTTTIKPSQIKTSAKPLPTKRANPQLRSKSVKVPGKKADLDLGAVPSTKPLLGLDAGHARLSVARQRHRSQRKPSRTRSPTSEPSEDEKSFGELDGEAKPTPSPAISLESEQATSLSKSIAPGKPFEPPWKADLHRQLEQSHLKRQARAPDTKNLQGPSMTHGVNLVVRERVAEPSSQHSPKGRASERKLKRFSSAELIERAATLAIPDQSTSVDKPSGGEEALAAAAMPGKRSSEVAGDRQRSGSGRLKTVDLPVKTLSISSSPSLNDSKARKVEEPNWVALARGKSERLSKRDELSKKESKEESPPEPQERKVQALAPQSSTAVTPSWVAMAVAKQRGTSQTNAVRGGSKPLQKS